MEFLLFAIFKKNIHQKHQLVVFMLIFTHRINKGGFYELRFNPTCFLEPPKV